MLTAQLDGADPDFPVSLVEADPPALPRSDWARVQVTHAGICGSDLHVLHPSGPGSPVLSSFVGFPAQLGHEICGVVAEAGADCPVPVGTLVAVDPVRSCATRGLPLCPSCEAGVPSACEQLDHHATGKGFLHGFSAGVGGGWSTELVAHHSQLHAAPPGVEGGTAVLTEPLAVSMHALLRRPPVDGEPTLVVGAGTIGLTALVAHRALAPRSEVTLLAKHRHQADAARRLGADRVVMVDPDGGHLDELAAIGGGRVVDGIQLIGGFRQVVEAVGTGPAMTDTLRMAGNRAVVWELGAVGLVEVDLTPLYQKEIELISTLCYGTETHDGVARHTFDRALDVLAGGHLPAEVVVTHEFPLTDLRRAVDTAYGRSDGALKVLLRPT